MSSVSTTVASNKLQKLKIAGQSFEDSEQAVDAAIRQVDRAALENSVGSEKNAVMRQKIEPSANHENCYQIQHFRSLSPTLFVQLPCTIHHNN